MAMKDPMETRAQNLHHGAVEVVSNRVIYRTVE